MVVLEKHADFLRDFRGDTIHPSTLEILDELGLAERFLRLPHTEVSHLVMRLPNGTAFEADFRRLPTRFPFIAMVPQWDFLSFVTAEAARHPNFNLIMQAALEDLIVDKGQVRGVRYRTPDGVHEVRALLTVGADGRTSRTREAAHLPLVQASPPMDVLWFRLSRRSTEPDIVEFRPSAGRFVALINRHDYWQVAYVIPKGAFERLRAAGLDAFRRSVAEAVPELADRLEELRDWDSVKLLTVRADRLPRWYRPGLLCIGDAAHAMSPIGGVGINLAIQDAVETANLLWRPLRRGRLREVDLAPVQRRRELPVRLTQAVQAALQDRLLRPALGLGDVPQTADVPRLMRLALRVPWLRDLPARLIGLGVWRPRVGSPAVSISQQSPS